jgi:hypothetical protein
MRTVFRCRSSRDSVKNPAYLDRHPEIKSVDVTNEIQVQELQARLTLSVEVGASTAAIADTFPTVERHRLIDALHKHNRSLEEITILGEEFARLEAYYTRELSLLFQFVATAEKKDRSTVTDLDCANMALAHLEIENLSRRLQEAKIARTAHSTIQFRNACKVFRTGGCFFSQLFEDFDEDGEVSNVEDEDSVPILSLNALRLGHGIPPQGSGLQTPDGSAENVVRSSSHMDIDESL